MGFLSNPGTYIASVNAEGLEVIDPEKLISTMEIVVLGDEDNNDDRS